jgi:hypothetical protein
MNQVQPYWNNSQAIRQEIQRFESVHPSIYAIYDLIESIPDPVLGQQIRDHVVCIEGKSLQSLLTSELHEKQASSSFEAITNWA